MAKKKKIIYETGDDGILSQEELNRKDIQSLNRHICKINADLYACDSEYGLRQMPELKKRLDNLADRLAINDNELRIYRDIVSSLQSTIYPLAEAYEMEKNKSRLVRKMAFQKQRSKKRTLPAL